jgi:hypothetical protein
MRFLKLRIAWSVACGIVCLLLVALWVRSYWWSDIVSYRRDKVTMYRAYSDDGLVIVRDSSTRLLLMHDPPDIGWTLRTTWSRKQSREEARTPLIKRVFRRFYWSGWSGTFELLMPYWLSLMLGSALGAAPWLFSFGWRFSLRTLLIATTLVAVGLGVVIVAAR